MLAGLQYLFSVGVFSPERGPTIKVSQPDVHWLVFLTVGIFSPERDPAAKGGVPVGVHLYLTCCTAHRLVWQARWTEFLVPQTCQADERNVGLGVLGS